LAITLAVIGVKEGKVDPTLTAAVAERNAACRAAAGLVLGRSGTAEQRKAVQALLADPDPLVRLLSAQGLLAARERAAVPALIALLQDGPEDLALRASDLLACLATRGVPQVGLGREPRMRLRYRRSWESWWRLRGPVDLARAEVDLPPFNPGLQARLAARRWLNALVRGDSEVVKKGIDVPFYPDYPAHWGQPLNTPEDAENYLTQTLAIGRDALFTLGELRDLESHLRRLAPADQDVVRKARLKTADLRLLAYRAETSAERPGWRGRPNGVAEQVGFLLLRVRGDQVRIVGGWSVDTLPLRLR
jgi:hypothetical protein